VQHLHAAGLAIALLLGACSSGGDDSEAPTTNLAPPAAVPNMSALFVLGDSLSDVGNAAGVADYLLRLSIVPPTVGLCNPADIFVMPRRCDDLFYRQSRVSDGPVAVERLAAHVGLPELAPSFHVIPSRPNAGTNYAVASAKARGPEIEDLAHQVDRLLLDRRPLPADALYVVIIGGNDAIDALQVQVKGGPAAAATSAAVVGSAVAEIGANVERLLAFGARRIVVANVPDLAALPAVIGEARASADPAANLTAASSISATFNRDLGQLLEQIAIKARLLSPPPVIVPFDLHAALQAVKQEAAARGANVLDACFDSDVYRQSPTAERVFHAACSPAPGGSPRFEEFVFWDGIHPTSVTHAALGAALVARVDAGFAVLP
jgi:outer membrane lipase/esterase